jgi:hypothetical protein
VTSTRRRRTIRDDDTGSVLVMSLVIVTVVALVVGGLLSYAEANVKATVALRSQAAAAATADGAAQAALNELRQSVYNNDLGSATYSKCFGADNPTGTTEGDDVLALSNLIPGSTGAAANSAAVRCTPDPSTGASGDTVPITTSNKPGNAIFTTSTNAAENGLEVKALNAALPFNVHGGIISKSNIAVTDGALKSTVDVRAQTGCTGTITSTPPPVCVGATASLPNPVYSPEITAVPTYRTVPTSCPAGVATFEPGYYIDASALSNFMDSSSPCKNSVWWFKPGTYYFDFQNSGSHQWQVKTGQLLAGTPVNGAGIPIAAPSKPISVPGACDNPIHSETAVGVQFVFGGDSQFQVVGTADAEICGSYHTDRPPLAVFGLQTSGTPTTDGGPGKTATTVNVTGYTATAGSTPVQAVAAAGDGTTLAWTGNNGTPTVNATAFDPTLSIPVGSTLTSAKVRILYGAGSTAVNKRELVVTPTPGTALATRTLNNGVPSTTVPVEVDLTTDLAPTVATKGLTGLNLAYTLTKNGAGTATDVIDAITLDLTWTAPVMRAQSGCITQTYSGGSGCAVISTTESYSGHFYIQGTTYVPLAPVDISLSNITAQVLRFGVISRVLRVKETGAVSYQGPVIEIPDDSPGYGPGGTVVLLEAYVCQAAASCEPPGGPDDPAIPDGRLGLRVRAYIKDPGAPGPADDTATDKRRLIVQSWATQR